MYQFACSVEGKLRRLFRRFTLLWITELTCLDTLATYKITHNVFFHHDLQEELKSFNSYYWMFSY